MYLCDIFYIKNVNSQAKTSFIFSTNKCLVPEMMIHTQQGLNRQPCDD